MVVQLVSEAYRFLRCGIGRGKFDPAAARGGRRIAMKRTWIAAAAVLAALPATTQAQTLQYPGFYIGAEGGINWMFNTSVNVPGFGGALNVTPNLGWAAGGSIGYHFVGPRVALEG